MKSERNDQKLDRSFDFKETTKMTVQANILPFQGIRPVFTDVVSLIKEKRSDGFWGIRYASDFHNESTLTLASAEVVVAKLKNILNL